MLPVYRYVSVQFFHAIAVVVVVFLSDILLLYTVYGWGSDTFTRPEAQFAYDVPLAYFKGPPGAVLRMSIDYNGEGTGIYIVANINT